MQVAGTRNERLQAVYSLFSWRHPRDFNSTTIPKGKLVGHYCYERYVQISKLNVLNPFASTRYIRYF